MRGFVVAFAACTACAGTDLSRALELQRGALVSAGALPRPAHLRTTQTPDGPAYVFLASNTSTGAAEWLVTGRGGYHIAADRIAVVEHVDLRPSDRLRSRWSLELSSDERFRLVGTLTGAATYAIDSIPSGELPLGDAYGARTICFLRDGVIVATVDLHDDGARLALRPGLDAESESLFSATAGAIALRRHLLSATGTRATIAKTRGLSDFNCITWTCDHIITFEGQELRGPESVTETIHHGRR